MTGRALRLPGKRRRTPTAPPSPRVRGRDERSSLLEGQDEGLSRQARLAESPPHPPDFAALRRATSPRKRGEVIELAPDMIQLKAVMRYTFADAEPGTRPNNCACSRRATSTSRPVASSMTVETRAMNSRLARPGGN